MYWEYEDDNYYSSGTEILNDENELGAELDALFKITISCVMNNDFTTALQAFEQLFSISIDNEDIEGKTDTAQL